MVWDIVLALLASASQFVTAYLGWRVTVDKVKRERQRLYKRIFILVGIIGVFSIVVTAYRGAGVSRELAGIRSELSGASVGLAAIGLWPPIQRLLPDQEMQIRMVFRVSEGTAKGMQCWFQAFSLPGAEGAEQDRLAISRFRQTIAREAQATGEDRIKGTSCYKDLLVKFSQSEISELIEGRDHPSARTIYAMGRAQWKNESGADFHTEVCKWMEAPKNMLINNPGWHDCGIS